MILCCGDVGFDDFEGSGPAQTLPGGCALNVALAARERGATVGCAAPLGDDGGALRALLKARGVSTEALQELPGATPRQRIVLHEGERELCGYRGGVLSAFRPEAGALQGAAWVHLPVFEQTEPWLEELWELGSRLALDLMDLSEASPELVAEAQRRAGLVFCGLSPEHPRLGALEEGAQLPGAALTIVTLGAAGVRVLGPEACFRPAWPLERGVIDTTGCGDAFAGAFLARWHAGAGLEQSLEAGLSQGARAAQHLGAVSYLLN